VEANKAALEAHRADLKLADAALLAAESTPAVDLSRAGSDLASARTRLGVERGGSVMHRAASAWFGVNPAELSDDQFQAFARVAIGALAISISTATMLAAFVSNLPRWDGKPGKLSRAVRATLASMRKRLRRIEPTIVTQFRDHTVYVHVPVSPDGVILDQSPKAVDPRGPRVAAE
jgi:hypothetical protein